MKLFNKKILPLILCIFMFIPYLLTGCTNSSQVSSNNKKQTETIVIKDGLGRKIEINKKIDRVLTNYVIATHMVFALGASDKLVGVDKKSLENPFFNKINSKTSKSSNFNNKNSFNMEEALSLHPDLVLISGKNKKLIDDIEKHGLKVFVINAENLDELKDTMKSLGKAFQKEKEADAFIKYYDDTISLVKKRTENLKDTEKPKVYLSGPDLFSTCGKDMYQNYIISLAGGKNVSEDLKGGWSKISLEQIIRWNPDVILLTQYSGVKPEDVLKNTSLQGVAAVKNKKVYLFPSKICAWDIPSPQAILGIEWLSLKLNPDKFKDIDIRKESDKVFKLFYNKTFSEFKEPLD